MEAPQRCPQCDAVWTDGVTCEEHFHQFGYWELENPSVNYEVHHLMVLAYHLQHPNLYSPDGLTFSKKLLKEFLETDIHPFDMRKRISAGVDSGNRKFKIKATAESFGGYAHPVHWTMTASDVTARSEENYVASIKAWARSIYDALKASGNL
jgi:hypothetical protein